MAAQGQISDFISEYRQQITNFLNAREELVGLFRQYNELGYSGSLVNGDFVGENSGITASDFTTAVGNFNTYEALLTSGGTIGSGFGSTLYALKKGA